MGFCGHGAHNMGTMEKRPGAQVLHRAVTVLRALSSSAGRGLGTGDVAIRVGLSRSTAHRILFALEEEGLVDYEQGPGRWFLGPELYVLGEIAGTRFDITAHACRVLREVSRVTGESAFLSVRRQQETVCLLREEGSFPLRSFVLSEGVRFPLGVASAGLAILAFMPDSAVNAQLEQEPLQASWGPHHSPEEIRHRLQETRSVGYSLNPGLIVPGSWGMGAAVFDSNAEPMWAISITGVESRFTPDRIPELGAILLHHSHQLSATIRQAPLRKAAGD